MEEWLHTNAHAYGRSVPGEALEGAIGRDGDGLVRGSDWCFMSTAFGLDM